MKIKILHDVFNISKRIKKLNKYYFIIYDTDKCKFEVHNSKQTNNTYCLTLPFNQLDFRALKHTQYTSTKNLENILKDIDNQNKLKESDCKTSALNQVCDLIEQEEKK